MIKTVLLLRHGEESDIEDSPDLSDVGRRRAENLAPFITKKFGKPDFVYSVEPSNNSVRCYLTVRPLADALKIRVDASYKADEFGLLASRLLMDPALAEKLVVVCWSHKDLPALAASLNVRMTDFPRKWDEQTFNQIYALSFKGKASPKVKKVTQPF